ncbi:MAG: SHOCT domain-containing protein [Planctomycetota bacterium]
MKRLACGALCALLLLGCRAAHPLGEDFSSLERPDQLARAGHVVAEVFATQLGPAGEPRPDREVVSVTSDRIEYVVDGRPVTLPWERVVDLDVERFDRAAGRPETVRLLLDPEAPVVADAVRPFLARAGLKRAYVELALRPPHSADRLRAALVCFREDAAPPPASVAPVDSALPADTAPVDSDAWTAAEAQLRRLKQWHDEGLISDEDYDRERRDLLDALR